MFNASRLKLAKARRGMTARALAEQANVGVDTITRLEQGRHLPEPATVSKLARALDYPEDFFFGETVDEVAIEAVSFRSFSKMTAKERDAAIAAGTIGQMLNAWVEQRFGLPEPDLLDLSYETDPEVAADSLRRHWVLGNQPIGNLLALFEAKGIRLFSLAENTSSVNAFSFWRGGKPFMYLNNFKTAESSRFDAAHELGHLILHRHGDPKEDRALEREADRFASAFLMPADDVRARIPHSVAINTVLQAKMRWRVSAMAMAFRLHALKMISDWQYKSLCVDLTRRGYRTSEPIGIQRETSFVWKKILTELWKERISKNEIAKQLCIPIDELEALIWSLTAEGDRVDNVEYKGLRVV